MLTDQFLKKLDGISNQLKDNKKKLGIYKVPPQVESSLYNLMKHVDNWFVNLSKLYFLYKMIKTIKNFKNLGKSNQ